MSGQPVDASVTFEEFFGAKRILVQEEIEIDELLRAGASDDSFSRRDLARDLVTEARQEPPIVLGKKAKKKLAALQKAAKAVETDRHLTEFSLGGLIAISQFASLSLKGQRGARRKDAATRVARLLAQHFEELTGSPPARNTPIREGDAQRTGGRFIELLEAIYRVLGIRASADSQAKSAIEAMEKNISEFEH